MSPVSSCAAFAITSGSTVELAPGLNFLVGPSAPGRRASSRHCTWAAPAARSGPRTSVSWCGSATRLARVELAYRGEGGAHRIEVVLQPGAPKLIKRDGAKLSVLRADPIHSARVRVRARPPRAGEGSRRNPPRASRRARDGAVAGPPGDAGWRTRRRWRSATRCSAGCGRAAPRRPRSVPGTASWRGTASS